MMQYIFLEKMVNLYDGYCQSFQVAGQSLLLVQDNGVPVVLVNKCPHMDARMDGGIISDGNIRCPVHGIQFNLTTGMALGPLATCIKHLQKLPHGYEGSGIGVYL